MPIEACGGTLPPVRVRLGVNFTHQGDTIFATRFTCGIDGKPIWLMALMQKTAPNVYAAGLRAGRHRGPLADWRVAG